MQFQLNITISSAGLTQIINAGQSVTIVRTTSAFVMTSANLEKAVALTPSWSVAWLAFQPYANNIITWTDACNLFASTTTAALNEIITVSASTTAAQAGQTWTFSQGQFSLATTGSGASYFATNQASNGLSFGLLAAASVNETSVNAPLNLQAVLYNQTATFTPTESVTIFLSTAAGNGAVIPYIGSAGLTVPVTSGTPVNIGFNDNTNEFYVSGS